MKEYVLFRIGSFLISLIGFLGIAYGLHILLNVKFLTVILIYIAIFLLNKVFEFAALQLISGFSKMKISSKKQ